MYARSGSLILGRVLVTGLKPDDEEKRKEQYEYHLRSGMKIPPELLPKEERRNDEGDDKDGNRTGEKTFMVEKNAFRPSIAVNREPKDLEERNSKP